MKTLSRRAGLLAAGTWLVALAAATLATPAEAQWRWRDASGRVTASDRPPPKEIPDKDILSRPSTPPQRRAAAVPADAASAAAPAASGAVAPASMVQARHSSGPAVRKLIRPRRA